MRRGSKPAKAKVDSKRSAALKSRKSENSRVRNLENQLAEALQGQAEALKREAEALNQQTGTAQILRVISNPPTDIQPVFEAIVTSAAHLCDAIDGTIFRVDGDKLVLIAHEGPIRTLPVGPFSALMPGSPSARAALEGRTIHVVDLQAEVDEYPEGSALARSYDFRTVLCVPLIRAGAAIGVIAIRRTEARPFTKRQADLLQTFADQAVIAIENVRLFTELEARNRDLATALEKQTATAEILRVISRSPTDLQPVFDELVVNARQLLRGYTASLLRLVGDELHLAASSSTTKGGNEALRSFYPVHLGQVPLLQQAIRDREPLMLADIETDSRVTEGTREVSRVRGYRSMLSVPLTRRGEVIGVIGITRRQSGRFASEEIELLRTFADQAVIAIENVRLFSELQDKNRALTEALDQQTATSEILRVISSSPTDVQPVFDTIARSATRLCRAVAAAVFVTDGRTLYEPANYGGAPEALAAARARYPRPLDRATASGTAILTRSIVHVPDVQEPSATGFAAFASRVGTEIGFRSLLSVPMLREDEAVGAINVTRSDPGLFSDTEVALLKTFADQAVIAIENVRLFTELQEKNEALTQAHAQVSESLEQQTATSEVLKVISRSTFDLQPVLDTLIENAARLCGARRGVIFKRDEDKYHGVAFYNTSRDTIDFVRAHPISPGRHTITGRVALERRTIHVADVQGDPEYGYVLRDEEPIRTELGVPMFRDDEIVGVIILFKVVVELFNEKQIELVETFADQAVIAIENARLLGELQARTTALTRSVEELTALGEVSRALSSTLELETVLETIVTRAVQLSNADAGTILEYDEAEEVFQPRVSTEDQAVIAALRVTGLRRGEGAVGRMAVTQEPVQIPDIGVEGAYESGVREALRQSGRRAVLALPLLREEHIIGGLVISRNIAGEFPGEIVELLTTFATQSALAIQNARLFRQIEQKSRELEAASHHKSEFLANMSHELRTPLNAVIGFSEVLSERMFGDLNEKQDEYLKDIHASGQHLLSLINDILDLSKIEAGRMELELSDFDLPVAIDNAMTLIRERAARRSIELRTSVDERLGQIQGDERKIRQVLLNLLSNAIKFTPEGGRIEVRAKPVNSSIELSVSDTGVGIAPEDQEAVFEEFRQVGTADKKVEGTGLGLALSRKFIELHGGKIWVKSQVGAGSTFTFTVPVRPGQD